MLPEQAESSYISLLWLVLFIVYGFFLWRMIFDVWNNDKEGRWGQIMFMLFVPFIGSMYYWYSVKHQRDKINKKFSSK